MALTVGELQVILSGDPRPLNRSLDQLDARAGQTEQTHVGAWRRVAVAAGAAITAIGIGAFVRDTVTLGNQYTGALNNVQAVTQATAAEMARVKQVSRELGSDLTLPATSAYDAASAMEELAKGGLSVTASMDAAKGTLMLAAAAQIDAANAAGIQANALNTFGLAADQANRVADVLANTANVASGEITDFAAGLQQSGTVANLFGISLEDTAASLAIFANAGIQGSDAGTSLKTALVALTSPTLAQQRAMDELGLTAYDAQGKFVGLAAVSGALSEAQGRLTQEQFNAAAATIFGTDAIRAAALFADAGADGFNEMAAAVSRQGGAAQLAEAKTRGLGGALDGLQSQIETFQIDLYERAAPNIERLVRYAAENLPKVGDAVLDGVDAAIGYFSRLKDRAQDAFEAVADYVEPVTDAVGDLAVSFTEANGPADLTWRALRLTGEAALAVFRAVEPLVGVVGDVVGVFADLPGPLQTSILLLGALKLATSGAFSGMMQANGVTRAMSSATTSVVGFAQTTALNMRLADESMGLVQRGAGGLYAAVGTYFPRTTGLIASNVAAIRSSYQQASLGHAAMVAQIGNMGQVDRFASSMAGLGAATATTARVGIGGMRAAAGSLVGFLGGPWGAALTVGTLAVGAITSAMAASQAQVEDWGRAMAEGGQAAADALAAAKKDDETGFFEGIGNLLREDVWSNEATSDFVSAVDRAREASREYYASLAPLAQAQIDVRRETNDLSAAIRDYGENSPQATAAAGNLEFAQNKLANAQTAVANATESATDAIGRQVDAVFAAADANVGLSNAQIAVRSATVQYQQAMADSTLTADQRQAAENTLIQAYTASATAAGQKAAAEAAGLGAAAQSAASIAAQSAELDRLIAEAGVNAPAALLQLRAGLNSAGASAAGATILMDGVTGSVVRIPGQKSVRVDALTDAARSQLEALGFKVTTLPNGQVRVEAQTAAAEAQLNEFVSRRRTATVNVQTIYSNPGTSVKANGGIGFAYGGYTGDGGKNDVAGVVHAGEFVLTKEQTARAGLGNLYALAASLSGSSQAGPMQWGGSMAPPRPSASSTISVGAGGGGTVKHYHFAATVREEISPARFLQMQREAEAIYS